MHVPFPFPGTGSLIHNNYLAGLQPILLTVEVQRSHGFKYTKSTLISKLSGPGSSPGQSDTVLCSWERHLTRM